MELDKQVAVDSAASTPRRQAKPKKGLNFHRFFTQENRHPFDELEWEIRDARISNSKGEVIFEQAGVEVPIDWSMTATNIVASKYFHGQLGTPCREYSVKQLISRVVETITGCVAIVDDVSTTGATLQALACALHQAGARAVDAWCVARAGRRIRCDASSEPSPPAGRMR